MRKALAVLAAAFVPQPSALAQNPLRHWTDAIESRYGDAQPVLAYTLRVDSTDLSAFAVRIDVRNAADTFQLALSVHPEYDDRFYRFVEDLTVVSLHGAASVTHEDSTLWRVVAPGGACTVRYRMRVPHEDAPRPAWHPFLTPTGGLVGGADAFMYVVGHTLAPAHVTLDVPDGWVIATGLEPTSDPHTFYAPSAFVLMESPMLIGRLREWKFHVDGTPHRVAYWPGPDATSFDTTALVDGLTRLAQQADDLFGRLPYREYDFLLEDRAYGALEHANSVTMGAPSDRLAGDMREALAEAAHEYFHAWNMMRVRLAEYGDVTYRTPPRSHGLWWGEGATMYFADLLLRRAGLGTYDSTRVTHLESLIGRYLSQVGNSRFAPESVSVVTYGSDPAALGDYDASVHLQGELISTLLDFRIRDATDGRHTLADVMRLMLQRFSGARGYTGGDVERAVGDVCGCEVASFFDTYVRAATALDFDHYLGLMGLRARVTREAARDRDGRPYADLRVYAWMPPADSLLSLRVIDPAGVWGRAGLHTGDKIVAVNGAAPTTWQAFRLLLANVQVGDTVRLVLRRNGRPLRATVTVTGYDRPVVRIEDVPHATERERALRERWVRAD
jgi:predicted metalloprotease with PDZ domain